MSSRLRLPWSRASIVAWAASSGQSRGDGRSISKVNGSVKAAAGETYDTVSTVNGNVHIERGATADEAEDGQRRDRDRRRRESRHRAARSMARSTSARAPRSRAKRRRSMASVKLASRARVGGDVSTVSGDIELHGAEVGGKLITNNGDIELTRRRARARWHPHQEKQGFELGLGPGQTSPKCTSAPPAWSRANCASTGPSSCASTRAERSAR